MGSRAEIEATTRRIVGESRDSNVEGAGGGYQNPRKRIAEICNGLILVMNYDPDTGEFSQSWVEPPKQKKNEELPLAA